MHPIDILNYYRNRYLFPVDRTETFARTLELMDKEKAGEDKRRERENTMKIKHDLLEATKKERELEYRSRHKVATEPKEQVQLVLVSGRWKRKKKKQN